MNDVLLAMTGEEPELDPMTGEPVMPEAPAPVHQLEEITEPDPLAEKWGRRIEKARKHYETYFRRCEHNRRIVDGLNWDKDPNSSSFPAYRANLIQGTITTLLPTIYAKNPEIEVRPTQGESGKLFASTLETVVNRLLSDAHLKQRAKAAVRAALTTSVGAVKVVWQQGEPSPAIMSRIQDTSDNLEHVNGLLAQLADPALGSEERAVKEELEQTMAALREKAEVSAAYGIVVDRIMSDNLLIDPTVQNFDDYADASWIAQIIPMLRSDAEAKFGKKLDHATVYRPSGDSVLPEKSMIASGRSISGREAREDDQICVIEIWDKATERVYTMADGCKWWLREPFSPEGVGERWYPFFLLPYQVVDGNLFGPSIVDLTEKLQDEHNSARDAYAKLRDLLKPGYIASSDVKPGAGKAFVQSQIGDVTFLDLDTENLQRAIIPKSFPNVNPAAYDTQPIRADWELCTGLQDAQRSSVVKAKTATEANIMANAQSGRVSEFQDQMEDWLSEIAQYAAEIALQRMTSPMVQRIMGDQPFEWPELAKEDVFYLVNVSIRAGSTGRPDKLQEQETWGKILPTLLQLYQQIVQGALQGIDVGPLQYMLELTVNRFDDTIDLSQLMPNLGAMLQQQQAQQQAMQEQQQAQQEQALQQQIIQAAAGAAH